MTSLLPQETLAFTLFCAPTAQERPRHTLRAGRSIAYKSAGQKRHEVDLDFALMKFRPEKPLSGGLELRFLAIMPMPQSLSRKAREEI